MGKKPELTVLGIDLGINTGWAHSDGSYGVHQLPDRSDGHNGARFTSLAVWLDATLAERPFTALGVELPHHRGGPATRLSVGLLGAVERFCHENGIAYAAYHTATVKKHATGSGRAEKAGMLEAAKRRNPDLGNIPHDAVDALWVVDLALHDEELCL